jgi:molybdopterin synthase catalytic subunit
MNHSIYLKIQSEPICLKSSFQWVKSPQVGGISSFLGTTRDHSLGRFC